MGHNPGPPISDGDEDMSLRDWFAGQALPCIEPKNVGEHDLQRLFGNRMAITGPEIAAALAYDVADEMLKRRKAG